MKFIDKQKKEIEEFLINKPGYLKKSPDTTSWALFVSTSKIYPSELIRKVQQHLRSIPKGVFKPVNNSKAISVIIDHPKRILFFDIETSYNQVSSWQIGRKINLSYDNIIVERKIITICYKFNYENIVHTLTWDSNQDDKKILEKFSKVLNSADIICAHNGDNFDIKHIRTRCMFHKIQLNPKFNSIDTLKLARSNFKLNSNTLNYIGQYLQLGKKIETGGLKLWDDIILRKDKQALKNMVTYCCGDVILLEKVYNTLIKYSKIKLLY